MNVNLLHNSDIRAMQGPTVTVTSGSDGVSVGVSEHEFGRTRLTAEEWAELAAKRGSRPYVLVDTDGPGGTVVSPLRTYADAMAEFNSETRKPESGPDYRRDYFPDSGRHLLVMRQDDYVDSQLAASARRVAGLRTAADLDQPNGDQS